MSAGLAGAEWTFMQSGSHGEAFSNTPCFLSVPLWWFWKHEPPNFEFPLGKWHILICSQRNFNLNVSQQRCTLCPCVTLWLIEQFYKLVELLHSRQKWPWNGHYPHTVLTFCPCVLVVYLLCSHYTVHCTPCIQYISSSFPVLTLNIFFNLLQPVIFQLVGEMNTCLQEFSNKFRGEKSVTIKQITFLGLTNFFI